MPTYRLLTTDFPVLKTNGACRESLGFLRNLLRCLGTPLYLTDSAMQSLEGYQRVYMRDHLSAPLTESCEKLLPLLRGVPRGLVKVGERHPEYLLRLGYYCGMARRRPDLLQLLELRDG